jgi:hypothetical protein
MSNVPFRLTVLTGCLALACACARTLTVTDMPELSLRAAAAASTKADPELAGASLGTDNDYVIYAAASADGAPRYFDPDATSYGGQLFAYFTDGAKWFPASGSPYAKQHIYWPFGGVKVDILAYALTPAAKDALSPTFHADTHAREFTVADWNTYDNQYDVMYAVSNGQTSSSNPGGTVPLSFQHTMAVVGFTAKSASEAGIFTLKAVTLRDLQYRGELVIDNRTTEVGVSWTVPPGNACQCDKEVPLTMAEFSVPGSGASGLAIKCTDHLLVIPQQARSVELTYHVKNSIPDLKCTLALPRTVWKAGHRYIYDLVFTPTEIRVSDVTVTDWDGTPVDDTAIVSN